VASPFQYFSPPANPGCRSRVEKCSKVDHVPRLTPLVQDGAQHPGAGVGRQAGTGKAAVYRRWPSKTALVVAAVRAAQTDALVPDAGSLREDLLACARHYATGNERAATLLATLLGEAARDAELREAAFEAIGNPPVAALRSVVERWVERGEVDPPAPVDVLVDVIPSYAFRQVLTRGRALDESTAAALVDRVLLPALRHRPG